MCLFNRFINLESSPRKLEQPTPSTSTAKEEQQTSKEERWLNKVTAIKSALKLIKETGYLFISLQQQWKVPIYHAL